MASEALTKAMDRLNAYSVVLLDGGVSTELQRRGVPDGLWLSRASLDHWHAIVDMHRAYIDAGADVITTNIHVSFRLMPEPAAAALHAASSFSTTTRFGSA
jgi:S-methylmethionine-dependent homocysteine/selenocysteine methylase